MNILKIKDGSHWPDPNCEKLHNILWKARHVKGSLTQGDLHNLAMAAESYIMLIAHPCLTLKDVQNKVSQIRKEMKGT